MTTIEQRHDIIRDLRSRDLSIPNDVYLDMEKDRPRVELRDWPWWAAIWPRPRADGWEFSEGELTAIQASWDKGKKHVDAQNELHAEIQARKAQDAEQKRIEAEKQAAATRETLLIEPKRAYLAAGGTEAEWDKIKNDVAAEIAKQQAIAAASPQPSKPVLPKSAYL